MEIRTLVTEYKRHYVFSQKFIMAGHLRDTELYCDKYFKENDRFPSKAEVLDFLIAILNKEKYEPDVLDLKKIIREIKIDILINGV